MRIASDRSSRFDPTLIRLPLIALIDVVFFLLFYFVISYSVSAQEAELTAGLARTGVSESPMEPQVLLVSQVDDQPQFRIGLRVFSDRAALTDLLRALPKDPGLIVRAAPDAPIFATAAAMQAGKDAGFAKVLFAVSAAGTDSNAAPTDAAPADATPAGSAPAPAP